MLEDLKKELYDLKDSERAKVLQSFFKTGKGEYGEGQIFLGIPNAPRREIARKYKDLELDKVQELLDSNYHDHKFVGMEILVVKYKKDKETIVNFYLKNSSKFCNWDLVDLSAYKILGDWLLDKDRKVLYELAKSENLWDKRIAIISTYAFIRKNQFEDTLQIAEILLNDLHDLMHKAVGWMLREVGNRDRNVEEKFLKKYYKKMPRTMLRYAIEKFPEDLRQKYLKGKI